jgi:hypothetical protein
MFLNACSNTDAAFTRCDLYRELDALAASDAIFPIYYPHLRTTSGVPMHVSDSTDWIYDTQAGLCGLPLLPWVANFLILKTQRRGLRYALAGTARPKRAILHDLGTAV